MYRTCLETVFFHQNTKSEIFSAFRGLRVDQLRLGMLEQALARLFFFEMTFSKMFVLILFEGDRDAVVAGLLLQV